MSGMELALKVFLGAIAYAALMKLDKLLRKRRRHKKERQGAGNVRIGST